MEDLRSLHEERKTLRPENSSPSPHMELEELIQSKMDIDEEEDQDREIEFDDEEPQQGRSLRRANDRALQRKKKNGRRKLRPKKRKSRPNRLNSMKSWGKKSKR